MPTTNTHTSFIGPFDQVGIDVINCKFPCSTKDVQYVVAFMDCLTKWPEVFALAD